MMNNLVIKGFSFFICSLLCCPTVADAQMPESGGIKIKFIGRKPLKKDTIQFLDLLNEYKWLAEIKDAYGKIISSTQNEFGALEIKENETVSLTQNFELDSGIIFKNYALKYDPDISLLLSINDKRILQTGIFASKKQDYDFFKKGDDFISLSFKEPKLKIKIEYKQFKKHTPETLFEIGSETWKEEGVRKQKASTMDNIFSGSYFLAFGLVFLILFLFLKTTVENFYFSMFCIFIAFTSFVSEINIPDKYEVIFIFPLIIALEYLSVFFSKILLEENKSKMALLVMLCLIGFSFLPLMQGAIFIEGRPIVTFFIFIILILYCCISILYYLIQGLFQKKWEARLISYGGFASLILIFIIPAIITLINGQKHASFNFSTVLSSYLGMCLIPVTMTIILGKRNANNYKQLNNQLIKIEKLSEENLQKEKEKQIILENQNELLEVQVQHRTAEVMHQKEVVEIKNREITDSIEYALRIQTAILPPQKIVKHYLENSFILYKPKDIVAGDFYWMETISSESPEREELILFAACDCTGHGVPGAMVSVVCHNALNRAVREFGLTQPAAILDKTAEIVVENFSKSEEDIKDGMDISLVSIKYKTQSTEIEVEWAGANNPLWIIRAESSSALVAEPPSPRERAGERIEETKADKQPIGMNEDHHPFTNQKFILNSGDSIYIFTDGFADQFGGATGEKKLTRKRFKEQILAIQHLSMQEQGIELDKFIVNYQKEVAQVDDILVMGVRL